MPPGTEDQRRAGGGVDVMRSKIGEEAKTVGVAADDSIGLKYYGVHRAGLARKRLDPVADLDRGLLVWNRHVGPGKSGGAQAAQRDAQVVGMNRKWNVSGIQPVPLDPEPMQPRRAGVADRPTDDPREPGFAGQEAHNLTKHGHAALINASD